MRYLFAAIVALLLLSGCGSSVSKSEVNGDGSWTRTIKLKTSKAFGGSSLGAKTDEFPAVFALPAGEGWSKTETKSEQEQVVTFTRTVAANSDTFTDLVVRPEKETIYKNYVYIRSKGDDVYEYFEKVVALKPKKDDATERARMGEYLKKNIPSEVNATDEEIKQLSNAMFRGMVRNLMGPDDFLIGLMMFNMEGAVRRLEICLGRLLDEELPRVFGERIGVEQRKQILQRIVSDFENNKFLEDKSSSASKEPQTDPVLGLSSTLKVPGKVLSTNGKINPFTGVVYWDFMTTTVDVEPMELRATFTLKP